MKSDCSNKKKIAGSSFAEKLVWDKGKEIAILKLSEQNIWLGFGVTFKHLHYFFTIYSSNWQLIVLNKYLNGAET
jgi:hypothetical protein